MERVHVVLAGLPRMLAEIVRRVLGEAQDLDVVDLSLSSDGLADSLAYHEADVLVTGLRPNQSIERFASLLRSHPSLRIFALEGDGRRAILYELQPHTVPLGDVSPEGLIDAIRSTVRVRNG
ncbi:MAG TPA: hypothetical protein VJU15_00870 [Gemmatimonadales bacterium]|nr:hypothetical protein [Gemmatimonadales bacterium]